MDLIAVFGLGHIGLPTAALFAKAGFKVIGVDINPDIVNSINQGISPIIEPGLDELLVEVVKKGKLKATDDGEYAARKANIMIIVVPTPLGADKSSDL
ncbi:MAG: nucleotide sugar dehydrogenase, partial [Methanobacteriales archaeon]|nr:nucleotide sugar dehydrogenase [Methanobacteriales archaeon]